MLLLLGVCAAFLFGAPSLWEQSTDFWGPAVGAALLGWALLCFGRVLLYLGQRQVADGWDKAREEDLINKMRRGRRVQQVLGVALQGPEASPFAQLDALLSGRKALQAQPSRCGQTVARHSRITGDTDVAPELALQQIFLQVLVELAPSLKQLPDDTPISLLLEVDSSLPEDMSQRAWARAWRDSGICQSTVNVEGDGLETVDRWLDRRITDRALLLVVAFQFAPQQLEGSAEVAVGLLFGNRLTQTVLPPIAYLHRPEQEREPTNEALLYAAHQALDWVPLDAQSIEQTWRAGIDAQRDAALATVMAAVPLPAKPGQGFCNVDTSLGLPGKASTWLAIAAATQTIQRGAGPQFIFSGGNCVGAAVWSTVLTPVPSLSK
jgi:hypothetical protein